MTLSDPILIAVLSGVISGGIAFGGLRTHLAWLRRDVDGLGEKLRKHARASADKAHEVDL